MLWLGAGDRALTALVFLGLLASVLLTLNVAPRVSIAVAGVCFVSFTSTARTFANYQSDGMLLEAAFASFFFAPRGLLPRLAADQPPSKATLWLLRWEWFRIYFESGVVKLASGDEAWRSLRAMDHYYENGPLPTWLGWYAQQTMPRWFHTASSLFTARPGASGSSGRSFCRGASRSRLFFVVTRRCKSASSRRPTTRS